MASDFCYVATGQPGLGSGSEGWARVALPVGPGWPGWTWSLGGVQ